MGGGSLDPLGRHKLLGVELLLYVYLGTRLLGSS